MLERLNEIQFRDSSISRVESISNSVPLTANLYVDTEFQVVIIILFVGAGGRVEKQTNSIHSTHR